MNTETQAQAILRHMRDGYEITALDALNKFNCLRLAARILDIKQTGIEIADRYVAREDGKKFKAYRIAS
jgi:hypothetical protein